MKKLLILIVAVLSVMTVQAQVQKYKVMCIKIGDIYQTELSWNDWRNPKSAETYLYIDKMHNKIIYTAGGETVFTFYIKQTITDEVKNNVRRVTWTAVSDEQSIVKIWHFTRYNVNTSSLYIYYDRFAVCLGLKKIINKIFGKLTILLYNIYVKQMTNVL